MAVERKPPRGRVVAALLLLAACAGVLAGVQHAGTAARRTGTVQRLSADRFSVHVTRTTVELLDLWKRSGVRGRIVVQVGSFLHFVEPESPSGYRVSTSYPLEVKRLPGDMSEPASPLNFLWVAFQANVAREIWNVLPEPAFRARFELPPPQALEDVREHELGSPRTISTRLPSVFEPVVLNVDASWFSAGDGPQLLAALRASGLTSDLVTVCLSEDNPDVGEAERARLLELVALLSREGAVVAADAAGAADAARGASR